MEATQTQPLCTCTQVLVDPVALTAALKTVRLFASQDPTRGSILNVYAEASPAIGLRLTATDGHTLCSVTISGVVVEREGPPARLTPLAVDALLSQAKAQKAQPATLFFFKDGSDITFPEYFRVVPALEEGGKTTRVHGFDALYLSRLGAVQKGLKARNTRIQFGKDENAGLRADIKGDLGSAVVVVMPVRL